VSDPWEFGFIFIRVNFRVVGNPEAIHLTVCPQTAE